MNIGKPKKIYTIEPVKDPVPQTRPGEPSESPIVRRPEPVREPSARP